ncbi:hypothetical protein ACH42_03810 [Endozoicomonas sp. (ex Bugula neritina AB1)]|nr:hypothetical protein ACH42_03810 [Endozoicomonas sp. (ex Bugula neritina AB1)]
MIGVSDDCMDAGGRATQEQLPSAANTPTSSKAMGIERDRLLLRFALLIACRTPKSKRLFKDKPESHAILRLGVH